MNKNFNKVTTKKTTISEKIGQLFDSDIKSDLKFVFADGKTIKAHRFILGLVSNHLDSLLSSDGNWFNLEQIDIKDFSFQTFQQFIGFLYGKPIDRRLDLDLSIELYALSNKYSDSQLGDACVELWHASLAVETCCKLYDIAILLDLGVLKGNVFAFMVDRVPEIVQTKAYDEMNTENMRSFFKDYFVYQKKCSELRKQTKMVAFNIALQNIPDNKITEEKSLPSETNVMLSIPVTQTTTNLFGGFPTTSAPIEINPFTFVPQIQKK